MARNLIPYGLLPSGNYGINLDNATQEPIATVLEVLPTLPAVASTDNAVGRLVFSKADATIFVFVEPDAWVPLEGVPATVGTTDPPIGGTLPPILGSEVSGELYWTTNTEVLFVWDEFQWQAAGGSFATQVIERRDTGTGIKVTFPAGITKVVPSEYVEVFIDGVRQNSLDVEPITGDYVIVGTNVVFSVPPVNNAEVFIRSMQSVQVVQNTVVSETITIASALQDTFPTGVAGTDPASIIVSVDKLVQVHGATEDYTVSQADTTIAAITKAFPFATIADVTTNANHGISSVGTAVNIDGTEEISGYNGTFVVSNIIDPTNFQITVPPTTSDSVVPNVPVGENLNMFFDPPFFADEVVFNTPFLVGGEKVYIKSFKNVVVAPSQGEANTIGSLNPTPANSLIPAGGASKVGDELKVKGLVAGANILITDSLPNDLVITASTGANFENRMEANGALIAPGATFSYVGVTDTNIPGPNIIIDLITSGVGVGGLPTEGRKITIKDEGGLAGSLRNIDVAQAGATFDGVASPYTISTDRGSVTLVYDGTSNWNITAVI